MGFVFFFLPSYVFFFEKQSSSKRAGQMVIERLALLNSANKLSLLLPLPVIG